MNRFGWALGVGFGIPAIAAVVYGCAFNPFNTPDYDERPGASGGKGGAGESSSTGGAAGQGISSGQGGSSGEGGMGGAPCTCSDDDNECTSDKPVDTLCPNGDNTKCHAILQDEICGLGWCSNKGECLDCKTCTVAAVCADRCDGIECSATSDCKSGLCEQGFCCNEVCTGPCKACDRSGVEGTCTRMPLGLNCGEGEACNVSGDCVQTSLAPLGAPCNEASQCTSAACRGSYCRSRTGEPCIEDIECNGNYCDPKSKTCQSCAGPGATCPGAGKCLSNLPNDPKDDVCQVLPGQPAPDDAECIHPAKRSAHMCKLPAGETCQRHGECQSHHCKGGVCDVNCDIDAHCPSGTKCHPNKVCTMLPGEYCIEAEYCASGFCSGFPRRCQP